MSRRASVLRPGRGNPSAKRPCWSNDAVPHAISSGSRASRQRPLACRTSFEASGLHGFPCSCDAVETASVVPGMWDGRVDEKPGEDSFCWLASATADVVTPCQDRLTIAHLVYAVGRRVTMRLSCDARYPGPLEFPANRFPCDRNSGVASDHIHMQVAAKVRDSVNPFIRTSRRFRSS